VNVFYDQHRRRKTEMPKRIVAAAGFVAALFCFAHAAKAQQTKGKAVLVVQTCVLQHTVRVLVCSQPEPNSNEPELRILLACNQDNAPACIQPFAGTEGYMEDLDPNLLYEGHNVRVEWLDGSDGTHNVVGAYQVQSSSVEKCEVR
jgi:hypothetical protein